MILFFDTETTGFPSFREPDHHPEQPHLVQLAAILTDDRGNEQEKMDLIVKPDGYEIPDAAAKVHRIDTQRALMVGLSYSNVLAQFSRMLRQADMLVAHNIRFDTKIMNIAYKRLTRHSMPIEGKAMHCTMLAATPVCKILHKSPRHEQDWKWPRLEEANKHFFNEDLDGAHDAMVDVRATMRLFFQLRDVEQVIAA